MKIAKSLGVATIAASLSLASLLPASSAPLGVPGNSGLTAPITLAASRDDWRRGDNRRSYKGYQGSRDYRRGYRRNNDGWWYPLAAFGLGAAIGSTFSQPRVVYQGGGNAHVDWCYSRWQSYRAYDNSYQPFNGPRRLCNSPYG